MSGDSYESALVRELQTLAGVPSGTDYFAIRCPAGTVTVTYKQWSSGPSDLKLEARYDEVARVLGGYRNGPQGGRVVATRPMDIHLRHEDREDRQAKVEGLNVEWQTGDRAFDDAVYVSTPGHGPEVMSAILTPEVRGAVMSLFELGFKKISLDDQGIVRAEVTEFVVARPLEGRGRASMDAYTRLLSNLPAVQASGAKHAPVPFAGATRAFGWIAGVLGTLFVASTPVAGFVPTAMSTTSSRGFNWLLFGPWVSIALGLPLFFLARKIHGGRVASRMRGSSRTQVTANRAGVAAGFCALFVVADAVHALGIVMLVLLR